jgi:hypothetical protein
VLPSGITLGLSMQDYGKITRRQKLVLLLRTVKKGTWTGMTWDELAWEFEMIKEIDERVSKNIRESAERERAYARNRRTSPFPGAEVYL